MKYQNYGFTQETRTISVKCSGFLRKPPYFVPQKVVCFLIRNLHLLVKGLSPKSYKGVRTEFAKIYIQGRIFPVSIRGKAFQNNPNVFQCGANRC